MLCAGIYQVGGVEVGLQLELLVEADALALGHLICRHVDHEPDGSVCVVLLVVTGGRQREELNLNITTQVLDHVHPSPSTPACSCKTQARKQLYRSLVYVHSVFQIHLHMYVGSKLYTNMFSCTIRRQMHLKRHKNLTGALRNSPHSISTLYTNLTREH